MTFREYLSHMPNIEESIREKYGDTADIVLSTINERLPVDLSYKYKIHKTVESTVFGQFMIAEAAFHNGIDPANSLLMIAKTIIRPIDEGIFDNQNEIREKENEESILEEDAIDVVEICNKYIQDRNDFIHNKFRGVFYRENDEEEEKDENKEGKIDTTSEAEKIYDQQWFWYRIKNEAANGRLIDHEAIEEMPTIRVAVHVAFLRIKGMVEMKRTKDQQLKQE